MYFGKYLKRKTRNTIIIGYERTNIHWCMAWISVLEVLFILIVNTVRILGMKQLQLQTCLLYYYSSRFNLWTEWEAKSKDSYFRRLFWELFMLGGSNFFFPFCFAWWHTKGGCGICKRWQNHGMELGMKGKVIFSGRFLYLEVDGLRGKRLPLIIFRGCKHWYAYSMKVSNDKQVR